MKKFSQTVSHLLHFFYPSFCLHCHMQIFGKERWICKTCFEQIEWIDPNLCCQICGKISRLTKSMRCVSCKAHPIYLMPFSCCFSLEGPAYHLYEYLRVYESQDIAKTFASFLLIKWKRLKWPFPDAIVPIPHSRLEKLSLKRQPNHLIAKELSKLFSVQCKPVLKTVERGEKIGFQTKTFFSNNLKDQTVYLISDIARKSKRVRLARDAILSLFPKSIYILTLFDER